jgi:hypothetical protein
MKINTQAQSLDQVGAHARQGDTLLRRLSSPVSREVKQIKSPTLALGERTGHHHTFTEGGAIAFADDELAATADYVRVTAPEAPLTHQEHETIVFPKGDYESLKQMEYTPAKLKRVAD